MATSGSSRSAATASSAIAIPGRISETSRVRRKHTQRGEHGEQHERQRRRGGPQDAALQHLGSAKKPGADEDDHGHADERSKRHRQQREDAELGHQQHPCAQPRAAARPPQPDQRFLAVEEMEARKADRIQGHREQRELDADGERLLDREPAQEHLHRVAEAGDERRVRADAVIALKAQKVVAQRGRVGGVHLREVGDVQLRHVQRDVWLARGDREQAVPAQ